MTRIAFSLVVCAWLSSSLVLCQTGPITIRAGLLIDGTGEATPNVRLIVEDGMISRIDRLRGNVTYDLSDLTVMPGLIDTHVHLTSHFDRDGKIHRPSSDDSDAEIMLYAAGNAQRTLLAGFTTVQSLGSRLDAYLREHIAQGDIWGPRVLTSLEPVTVETGDPAAIRAFVRQLKTDGADVVKVFASGSIRDGGRRTMSDAQIEAVCQEAADQGLRTAVHAYGALVITIARAGCTSVEHGTNYGDEAIEILAEHGTFVDPHLGLLYQNYIDHRDAFLGIGNYTATGFERMVEARRVGLQTFRRTRMNGDVKIIFGTDAVAGAHGRNADELVARVSDAGQRPMDAIVSATSRAAEALGLDDQIGTAAPGFVADLVAVEGNPLENIEAIRNIRWVMKGGEVYRNEVEPVTPGRRSRRRGRQPE